MGALISAAVGAVVAAALVFGGVATFTNASSSSDGQGANATSVGYDE
jgi:hypothetical protein